MESVITVFQYYGYLVKLKRCNGLREELSHDWLYPITCSVARVDQPREGAMEKAVCLVHLRKHGLHRRRMGDVLPLLTLSPKCEMLGRMKQLQVVLV